MKSCVGSIKATVTIFDNGKTIKVVSSNPGVEATIKKLIGITIKVTGDAEFNNAHQRGETKYYTDPEGLVTDAYSLRSQVCTTNIGCGANSPNDKGEAYFQAQLFKNGKYTGYHFDTTGWYSVAISKISPLNPEGASGKFRVEVIDEGGKIFSQDFDNPTVEISCDDECPEGKMKLKSNRPPGYCCISCADLKAGVSGIKARIR